MGAHGLWNGAFHIDGSRMRGAGTLRLTTSS
jgi:hypothetical protein